MDIQIATIFYLCDKLLEALNSKPHPQTQMSDAEVMTTASSLRCSSGQTCKPLVTF